jgi:hypothetical protein
MCVRDVERRLWCTCVRMLLCSVVIVDSAADPTNTSDHGKIAGLETVQDSTDHWQSTITPTVQVA